jgi:DNA-binding XRE family transcriptional regulator
MIRCNQSNVGGDWLSPPGIKINASFMYSAIQQRRWNITGACLKGEDRMKTTTSKDHGVRPHGLPHLRVLRQRSGLSLGQLSDMTGLSKDTITHLETGRQDPQPYQLRILARALNVQQPDLQAPS